MNRSVIILLVLLVAVAAYFLYNHFSLQRQIKSMPKSDVATENGWVSEDNIIVIEGMDKERASKMVAQLGEMYGLCYEDALAKAYEPDDEHDGFIPQLLTENEKFFYDDSRELYNRYHNEQDTQKAKWAAQFLIIMHIARRGKILHPDNARIALTRYGDNGEEIIAMLDDSHLAQGLHKKYHVTLMNKKLADSVIEKIEDLSRYADPKYSPRACRKLQQCKNFLKKFQSRSAATAISRPIAAIRFSIRVLIWLTLFRARPNFAATSSIG